MSAPNIIWNHPRLILGLVSLGALSAAAYLGKRKLNRACPRVPVRALLKPSACRNLIVERHETATTPAWGLDTPAVVSSLSSQRGNEEAHWTPSFVAVQVEVPVSLLAAYKPNLSQGNDNKDINRDSDGDAFRLMQAFVAAFLDARAEGIEAWFLDKDVPPLSFAPGSQLFGRRSGPGAFLLDTWSTARLKPVQPLSLPKDAVRPVFDFPTNAAAISQADPADAAGTVMYWKFPDGLVGTIDKAASYGLPWRLMEGGFQEFIVKRVSDETARLTYVSLESANLHPLGQTARDFKKVPWLVYELHVLYAQSLLYNAVERLRSPQR